MDNPYTKPGSVRVADVFKQGAVCPFMPGSAFATVEDMLASFDHPELLAIINQPPGIQAICLKTDVPYMKKREEVVSEVLAGMGMTHKDIPKLSIPKIMEMRERIHQILTERGYRVS